MKKVPAAPRVTPIDPFEEKKWMNIFIAYTPIDSAAYLAYRFAVIAFYIFNHVISLYTLYVVLSDKILTADVMHIYCVTVWHLWCIFGRMATEKSILKMREMINSGIYIYEKEELEDNQIKILEDIAQDIRRKSSRFIAIYVFGFFSVMLAFPLATYMMKGESSADDGDQLVNPYLPHPCYYPFPTDTLPGFSAAYLLDFVYWIYVYVTAAIHNGLIIFSTVHLKAHFALLNYSVLNIQQRTYRLYNKIYGQEVGGASLEELIGRKQFRHCMKLCLNANIQHHQALIRFKNICQPFNGLSLLNMFTVVVVIYAAMLYLLLQNIPFATKIKYAGTFFAENTYALYICTFGQEVATESGELIEALYGTSWMNYDKDFKQTLHIMMSNSRKPMQIKAMLLDLSATLESYSVLLSAMYKVLSIWRQSDKIK